MMWQWFNEIQFNTTTFCHWHVIIVNGKNMKKCIAISYWFNGWMNVSNNFHITTELINDNIVDDRSRCRFIVKYTTKSAIFPDSIVELQFYYDSFRFEENSFFFGVYIILHDHSGPTFKNLQHPQIFGQHLSWDYHRLSLHTIF